MKNNVSVLTVLIAVAGLAGCMDAAESEVEQQTGGGCGLLCQNSPEVAHYGLWEANLHGQPNSNSITISGGANAEITKGGLKYVLSVKDSRIMGLSKVNGTLSGQGLVGAQIQLFQGTQQYYSIRIDGVRPISFAVGAPDLLEAYVMTWISPLTGQPANKQFCNAVLDGTEYEKVFDLLGMRPNETVVFAGDRIDPAMMTTSPVADFNWFNFGCAGHTLAKAHLTRNTISSQPVPSWEGRQATLKMYSAMYCEPGPMFTLAGEPLVWIGGQQTSYRASPDTLEARWNEHGATCLGEPRLLSSPNPLAPVMFPNLVDSIRTACPNLPPCTNTNVADLDGALRVTANPKLPLQF